MSRGKFIPPFSWLEISSESLPTPLYPRNKNLSSKQTTNVRGSKKFLREGGGGRRKRLQDRKDGHLSLSNDDRSCGSRMKNWWRRSERESGNGVIGDSDRGWWRRRGVLGWKLPRSPAGDLELVIKYKEPCLASSRTEPAPVRRLFRPSLAFLHPPFGMPGIQRGLYLIRDFIRFTSSRGLGAVELGANDRVTPSPRSPSTTRPTFFVRRFL